MEALCIDSLCRPAVPKAYPCDLRERAIEAVAAARRGARGGTFQDKRSMGGRQVAAALAGR